MFNYQERTVWQDEQLVTRWDDSMKFKHSSTDTYWIIKSRTFIFRKLDFLKNFCLLVHIFTDDHLEIFEKTAKFTKQILHI